MRKTPALGSTLGLILWSACSFAASPAPGEMQSGKAGARRVEARSGAGHETWDFGADPSRPGRHLYATSMRQASAGQLQLPGRLGEAPLTWRLADGRRVAWSFSVPPMALTELPEESGEPDGRPAARKAEPRDPGAGALAIHAGEGVSLRFHPPAEGVRTRIQVDAGLTAEAEYSDLLQRQPSGRVVIRDRKSGDRLLAMTLPAGGGTLSFTQNPDGDYSFELKPAAALLAPGLPAVIDASTTPFATWGGYEGNNGTAFSCSGTCIGAAVGHLSSTHFTGYLEWDVSSIPASATVTGVWLNPINVNYFGGSAQTITVNDVDNGRALTPLSSTYDPNYYTDFQTMYGGHSSYGSFTVSAATNIYQELNAQAVMDLNNRQRTPNQFAVGLSGSSVTPGDFIRLTPGTSELYVYYSDYTPSQVAISYVNPAIFSDSLWLYNYGESVDLAGWQIQSINWVPTTQTFTLPAFTLARHQGVRIIDSAGSNTATTLYTGGGLFTWAGVSISPYDVRLSLLRSAAGGGGGADYVCFGNTSPAPPAGAGWNGGCVASSSSSSGSYYRQYDGDSDGAGDWLNNAAGALPGQALQPGMTGTRRKSDVFINHLFASSTTTDWISVVNYGPPVNLQGWTLDIWSASTSGGLQAYGVHDGLYTFPSTPLATGDVVWLAAGTATFPGYHALDTWHQNMGVSVPTIGWTYTPAGGEIILNDEAGQGRDYVAFGNIHHQQGHLPQELSWTGPFLPATPSGTDIIRDSDLNSLSDDGWVTRFGYSGWLGIQAAIGPNARGASRVQDELGSAKQASSFADYSFTAGPYGAGSVFTVTQQVGLEEIRIQAAPVNGPRNGLIVVKKQGAPNTIVYQSAANIAVGEVGGTYVSSGLISPPLVLNPGTYAVMLYLDGEWYTRLTYQNTELLSFGNFTGYTNESGFAPTAPFSTFANYAVHSLYSTIAPPAITSTTPLPAAESGVAYAFSHTSSGGYGASRTWSITAGALPAGLAMNSAGLVSGTPTATGTFNFTVQVIDGAGLSSSQAESLYVAAPITISTTTLPDAEMGFSYYQYLYPSGGQSPNSWTQVSGFPGWLNLSSYASYWGLLTGSPAATGAVSITVRVTDTPGGTDTQLYNFTVQPALQITTLSLSGGFVNNFYTRTLARSGGAAPFSWKIISGMQPNGLGLDPVTGVLSGTPQAAGTFNFTVQLTDYYHAVTQAYSVTITQLLNIVNTGLPDGVQNAVYPSTQMYAAGGNPPYTWTVTSGSLPTGLTLSSAGVIFGTPTTLGSSNFNIRATDSGSAIYTRNLTINVTPPPDTPQWSQRALFGGIIDKIVYSPNYATDNTVFTAAGYGAEIYKSTDRAANWQRVLVDPDNAGQYITSLVLSPVFNNAGASADQKTVFLSGWSIGAWKSVDGGLTFTEQSSGLTSIYNINALAVSPDYVNDRTLWLAKSEGAYNIYISTNAAGSWTLAGPLPGATSTVIGFGVSPDFANDQTIFAYTTGQVYRSVDGGYAWSSVYNPASSITNLVVSPDFARDHTLWLNAGNGELHRSRNSGTGWSVLTATGSALDATERPGSTPWLFMRAGSASGVYNLLRSDNQGDTFVPLFAQALLPTGAYPSSRSLSTSPLIGGNAADVFSGSSFGVTASFDNGFSFNSRQKGLTALDVNGLCGNGGIIVAAINNGWLKSADGGLSWGQAPSPGGSTGIRYCAVSPNYLNDSTIFLVTGSGGGLYRSTDDGVTFTLVYSSSQINDLQLAPGYGTSNSTLFLVVGSQLLRSDNAGSTFTTLALGASCDTGTIRDVAVSPNYATDGALFISREYAYGTGDGPCRSSDSGATWSKLLDAGDTPTNGSVWLPPNYNDDVISAAYSRTIMLVFDGFEGGQYDASGVWRSLDNGATWTQVAGQPQPPYDILYGRVVFSPNFALDNNVFVGILNARHEGDGVWRSTNGGANFYPLPGASDELLTRSTSALYLTPNFDGRFGAGIAVAGTQGSGLWRTGDSGAGFHAQTDMVMASKLINAYAANPVTGTPLYAATNGNGVYSSDDGGLTFTPLSKGLPKKANVVAIRCPAAAPNNPVAAVPGYGLFRWNGSAWAGVAGFTTGNYSAFTEDATYLYASRTDGVSLRSINGGLNWSALQAGETNLSAIGDASQASLVAGLAAGKAAGKPPVAAKIPDSPSAVTASLWAVAQASGPRYSTNSGGSWTGTPGSNDYTIPAGQSWTVVLPTVINPQSGGREVVAGSTTGLWRTTDGGTTWRKSNGAGSGLEATSGNFAAVLATTTASATTDVLVGAVGSTTGGVYLSGDGGEHFTQINQGFDPNSLSITSLVVTSCAGCPVQYYSGTYGSGVYTRTIAVLLPPAITSWCFTGTSCTCSNANPLTGPEQGGQGFKLCGANFQAAAAIEFGGVPATGCTIAAATITCTATPPHAPGAVTLRVRNPDTRVGYPKDGVGTVMPYTYTAGAPRAIVMKLAKSGNDVTVNWTCPAGCATTAPQIYRAQDLGFSLYLEHYTGATGTSGSYPNPGVLGPTSNPSYFWNME